MYTEEYKKIIKVCERYPDDILANIVFGKTVAFALVFFDRLTSRFGINIKIDSAVRNFILNEGKVEA